MVALAEGMPVSGSIEVVPGVINPITIAYARFQEARRQPWSAQTGLQQRASLRRNEPGVSAGESKYRSPA